MPNLADGVVWYFVFVFSTVLHEAAHAFAALNLILFLFNLLPLPPLDGSSAVQLLMGRESALKFMEFTTEPALGYIGIIVAWKLFDVVFDPAHLLAINLLYPGLSYG